MEKAIRLLFSLVFFSASVSFAADINWLEKAPMPVPVGRPFGYAVVDNNIYIIGGDIGGWGNGSTTVQKYTIATDTWETDANNGGVLAPLPQPRSSLFCGVINRKIHCGGGWDHGEYKGDHFIYNPDTNAWSIGPPIPEYPIGQSAAVVNNKMYVFGGWWGTYQNSVFEYSEEGGWSSKSPMPTARGGVFTGTYNGKIFVIGGEGGQPAQMQSLNVNEMYDPSSNTWSTGLPLMPIPGGAGGACSGLPLLKGIIYFLWDSFAYGYEPLTNSWTTLNPLPGSAVGVAAINGSLYAIGTEHTFQGAVGIDVGPRLARWEPTTDLPKPSAVAGLTGKELTIVNGRAYVFGGQNPTGSGLLTNVYVSAINADGSLGPWAPTTPLPKRYFDYATVAIGNYVYLITGANGSEDVYYAPIFADGSVGQWIPTAPLASRQTFAAAAYGNFIYVSGGNSGGTINLVTYTSVKPDGSLNPWQNTTALPEPIQSHTMVATHGRLYVVAPSNRVYYAAIQADGTVGPWTATSPLPTPLYGYSSFELNGYLYTVGGNLNTSYYAQILADGSLAAWQPTTALPATRLYTRAGVYHNFVYVAGGYDGTNFFKSVYYSRLATKVRGSVSGLQISTESCVNNTTTQTVNVANPGPAWNCEEAGLVVNPNDSIRMTVTGGADLSASVGGSATGLRLTSVRCINDTTRQRLTIDMQNLPPIWNCEAAGLRVNARDSIRININGSAE
jgi:N-acetylneuraminic acid mutarotase